MKCVVNTMMRLERLFCSTCQVERREYGSMPDVGSSCTPRVSTMRTHRKDTMEGGGGGALLRNVAYQEDNLRVTNESDSDAELALLAA